MKSIFELILNRYLNHKSGRRQIQYESGFSILPFAAYGEGVGGGFITHQIFKKNA